MGSLNALIRKGVCFRKSPRTIVKYMRTPPTGRVGTGGELDEYYKTCAKGRRPRRGRCQATEPSGPDPGRCVLVGGQSEVKSGIWLR